MKKINIVLIILVIFLVQVTAVSAYVQNPVTRDTVSKNNIMETSYNAGLKHGNMLGIVDGEIYGKRDYYEGRINDWRSQIKSDACLIKEYLLDNDSDKYMKGFLLGYRAAFEREYNNSYRQANINASKLPKENGIRHGREIGFKLGDFLGEVDFSNKKPNNWRGVLPSGSDIISEYNLMREPEEYRNGFLAGFREGFCEGYIKSFQQENVDLGGENINYKPVSILGEELTSADKIIKLAIDPGTIYGEEHISIQECDFPNTHNTKPYIPITNSYSINIENLSGTVNLHKPIMLTFKYYSTERGGIYQLVNNRWKYLYSEIGDGEIYTRLDIGCYGGGIYAVFVDNDYRQLKDIYTNWAGQEIYTFMRRDYIDGYSDNTFKPDTNISRAEFITLLGRVMNWNSNTDRYQAKNFSDYKTFGIYDGIISAAVSTGLINGYPDNTFRPNNKISYQETEWIMQRLPNNNSFSWEKIEDKMLHEKYHRPKSFYGKKNNITRAEVVYMLYNLQNEGKI